MEQAAIKQDEKIGRGFVLSILLHVVLAAIFLLRPLMMPPQAPAEENVNVELVPQPQEQQENATKPKEASGQVPTPTPKPDEKTQQAEAQKQPEQKPGDPKAQSDQQDKAQGEKADAAANEQNSSTPTSKPEQQVPTEEIPLPEMKGNEKDPSTTQQADASAQTNATPTPNDNQAEDQATASPAKEPDVQPEQQASSAQSERDTQANQAKAASPVADPDSRDPASMPKPKELATDQPSDAQVAEPEAPATEQDGMDTQEKAAATSDPETERANAADPDPQQQPSSTDNKAAQQITLPTVAGPQSKQPENEQAASDNKSDPANGTSFVTEPDAKRQQQATKGKSGGEVGQLTEAKKLYSGSEMAKLSKSQYDAWKQLSRRDRIRSLCRSEALAQFGNYLNSALSPTMLTNTGAFGDGLAVQTPKGWQQVKFTCQVDDAALKVVAFSHAVVGRIPRSQLERLGLPEF